MHRRSSCHPIFRALLPWVLPSLPALTSAYQSIYTLLVFFLFLFFSSFQLSTHPRTIFFSSIPHLLSSSIFIFCHLSSSICHLLPSIYHLFCSWTHTDLLRHPMVGGWVGYRDELRSYEFTNTHTPVEQHKLALEGGW